MSTLLMVAWIALLFTSNHYQSRYRRNGVLSDLHLHYVYGYTGLVALMGSLWLDGGSLNHWFVVGGIIFMIVTIPWSLRLHRQQVEKYGEHVNG